MTSLPGMKKNNMAAKYILLVTGGDSSNKGRVREKNKFIPGIWRFCRESGNLGNFPGNLRYYRDIEKRFTSFHSLS